ncbi:MAG: hypothetical protein JETT_2703 [Candidatus Jettenia ecosi]|uniref:Uncharacterized protein n=1 Tax=Candidatus Jettenia ecosi TaxID=2494326 RepID=A0A533Q8T2_9BACT|nr:MAG: hypothetical protein JETT_2703 [Candidatus Jettenia ecosi]
MSEYQYYEFRTIDRPLTEIQKSKISSLSSRARVTSHSASFVYNYGDFRGNPEQLMRDYFDVMLYMANWGSSRLMFRIPQSLIDVKKAGRYCISEEISKITTKEHVIFDLNFHDEELAEWTEGEGWLDELVGLREELIQGDFRMLYLAWLKAAENALGLEDVDEDILEPPVPTGLNKLSSALKSLVRFFGIDEVMLAVAAQRSEDRKQDSLQLEEWVEKLPTKEQHEFLIRLSRGEPNLSVLLNRRLHELANKVQSFKESIDSGQRTIAELIRAAEEWRDRKQKEKQRKVELARKRRLEELGGKENEIWQQVESLIEEKKSKSYDSALALLKDMRELAEYRGKLEEFKERIAEIQQTYSNRPALRDRIRHAKLI